ncbi:MoxR family ATPase [Marichromatium gracile]|uniref:AAA family ATPase n=1 Tax=Marichromatium gracile TaxID=1048 RepID=UPI001F474986|nr:MoxR family ATPase [Marichromatium gracile]MCF1182439.1 MoxR family ATPase [Marichromatium gracile]
MHNQYTPKNLKLPKDNILEKNDKKGILPYVFTDAITVAIDVSLATNRPLLVSGNPGCGKSRLADAVAALQDWNLLSCIITSRTRIDTLTAEVDQLRRLNDAHIGRLGNNDDQQTSRPGRPDAYYLNPGIFWWAFDANSARCRGLTEEQANDHQALLSYPGTERSQKAGVVLLIDEIDKAEPDLPNDLLDPLDRRRFPLPPGFRACRDGKKRTVIKAPPEKDLALLTIITTNGERELPQAFLRRCVLLEITDPTKEELVKIATLHSPDDNRVRIEKIAERLVKFREIAKKQRVRAPGVAELLDAVHACRELGIEVDDSDSEKSVWSHLQRAVLAKDPAFRARRS